MTQQEAEQFLFAEARLLDQRRYEQWRQLFGEDGLYWVPVNDTDADPQINCSIIYASGEQLDDRLMRAGSSYFWANQPPLKSVHTITNVTVQGVDEDQPTILANQVIYLYRENDQRRDVPQDVLPATSEYRLTEHGDGWQITLKKLTFLQADGYLPLLPAFI